MYNVAVYNLHITLHVQIMYSQCHLYYKCHQNLVTDDIRVHCNHRELLTVLICMFYY